MFASKRALSIVIPALSCLAASASVARAQQQPTRFDVTHCYVGDATPVVHPGAYRAYGIMHRGVMRSNDPGGALDNVPTRCVGASARIGDGQPSGQGYCEFAVSQDDRVLIRWMAEGTRGSAVVIAGSGRYQGAAGEVSFEAIAPIPSFEPGTYRACNRSQGEIRVP